VAIPPEIQAQIDALGDEVARASRATLTRQVREILRGFVPRSETAGPAPPVMSRAGHV